MAKRKEIILQETLNTQESWEEAMSKENLYVVDAHQKWCGPCVAIVGMLKRIKNELGDDLLKFATSGNLVASVRGCNAPLIQSTIVSSLAAEHKVLNGEAERQVISDTTFDETDDESEEEEEIEQTFVPKKFTIAVIKPDVVSNGQVDEIIAKIEEAGIEILASEEQILTEENARELYKHKSEEEYFDDLIHYVTSGPCRVLILTKGETGEGVLELWRDIIGPFDAAVAKNEQPNSLRSIYGENATKNALHGSSSEEEAVRELGFFFPNYNLPTCTMRRPISGLSKKTSSAAHSAKRVERTLALIRPDALRKHKDSIIKKIDEAGFKIAMQKEVTLTREQVEDFYSEHKDKEYFEPLVKQMTCGPVLALCLASDDAVNRWRKLLGPKDVAEAIEQQPESLRALYSNDEESEINLLHGSDNPEAAEAELSNFFEVEQTLAVIKPDAITEKEKIMSKLEEAGFMISCQKDMNLSKEIASEIYKSKKGAEFYDDLVNHMTSGHTLMLVLSADNAVQKLRSMMGPPDPEVAKTEQPDSIRAIFAKSTIENAIHAPSSSTDAKEDIKLIFGDVNFNWDGTSPADFANENAGSEEELKPEEEEDKNEVEETVEEDGNQEKSVLEKDKEVEQEKAVLETDKKEVEPDGKPIEKEDRDDHKRIDGSQFGDGNSHGNDADDESAEGTDGKGLSDDKNDEIIAVKDEEKSAHDEEPQLDGKMEDNPDGENKLEENDVPVKDHKDVEDDDKNDTDDNVVVENHADDNNDTVSIHHDHGNNSANISPDNHDSACGDDEQNLSSSINPVEMTTVDESKQSEIEGLKQSEVSDAAEEDTRKEEVVQDRQAYNKSFSSSPDSKSDQEKNLNDD